MTCTRSSFIKPAETSLPIDAGRERDEFVRIPVKWVWHFGMLHSLRERLLQEQENASSAGTPAGETPRMNPVENTTDEFDHEIALSLLTREHHPLREIDAALQRILAGSYGICEESGTPIPAGRLHVVPWTRYTKEAEGRRKHEGLDLPSNHRPLVQLSLTAA